MKGTGMTIDQETGEIAPVVQVTRASIDRINAALGAYKDGIDAALRKRTVPTMRAALRATEQAAFDAFDVGGI